MFPIFARPRSTKPLWLLSLTVAMLVTTLAALSTTRVLAVSYQLSGKVTDQASTAIVGATVDVINPATSAPVGTTTTTASGTYALSIESGTYDIRVTPPAGSQFVPLVSPNRSITANTVVNFVLVPAESVSLSGQVRNPNGQGVAGQTVSLSPIGGGNTVSRTTDASGTYRLAAVPGNYQIAVSGSNGAGNVPGYYSISSTTTTPLALTENMTLDLPVPVKRVAVRVQDASGNPVANARITTNVLSNSNLVLGGLPASGYSEYYGSRWAGTNATGDAVLWLFPTEASKSYTFTVTPPAENLVVHHYDCGG